MNQLEQNDITSIWIGEGILAQIKQPPRIVMTKKKLNESIDKFMKTVNDEEKSLYYIVGNKSWKDYQNIDYVCRRLKTNQKLDIVKAG